MPYTAAREVVIPRHVSILKPPKSNVGPHVIDTQCMNFKIGLNTLLNNTPLLSSQNFGFPKVRSIFRR